MSLSRSSLKIWVLRSISKSFDPFKIGLRRKAILDQVIQRSRLIHDPITTDEKNALSMRLQRVLRNLVQEGLIKRENKGHQQTFYLLEKDAFGEYLEYCEKILGEEIFLDKNEYEKNFKQDIINRSDYLKLPEYMDMIPITDAIHCDVLVPYEEFRSSIMNVAVEILEPQIRAQYKLMKEDYDRAVGLLGFYCS